MREEREPLLAKQRKAKAAPVQNKIVTIEPGTVLLRSAAPQLDRMPTETLFMIFNRFSAYELLFLRLVAKRFHDVIQADYFWRPHLQSHFPFFKITKDSSALQKTFINLQSERLQQINQSSLSSSAKKFFLIDFNSLEQLSLHAKKLTIPDLITKINNKPVIALFSKNQAALDIIYKSVHLGVTEKLMHPSRVEFLALLCNQKEIFIRDFTAKIAGKLSLPIVEQFLLFACWLGYAEIVKHIIAVRPNMDLNKLQNDFCLLELATIEQHAGVVDALLTAGADSTPTNNRKRWMMHGAARAGNQEIYSIYLNHGANADLPDGSGKTAKECLLSMLQKHTVKKAPLVMPVFGEDDPQEIAYNSEQNDVTFVIKR